MQCERIVQGVLSPLATEEERRRAVRRLVSVRCMDGFPVKQDIQQVDNLGFKVALLMAAIGVDAAWPAFWWRVKAMYRLPRWFRAKCFLDPMAVLLAPPPWTKRYRPNAGRVTGPGLHGPTQERDVPPDSEEEREICEMIDAEISRHEKAEHMRGIEECLKQDRAELEFLLELGEPTFEVEDPKTGKKTTVDVATHCDVLRKQIEECERMKAEAQATHAQG